MCQILALLVDSTVLRTVQLLNPEGLEAKVGFFQIRNF